MKTTLIRTALAVSALTVVGCVEPVGNGPESGAVAPSGLYGTAPDSASAAGVGFSAGNSNGGGGGMGVTSGH